MVVGKLAAAVMISSPGLTARSPSSGEVRAARANRLAEEPELTVSTWRTPRYSPNCRSNCSLKRPHVSHASSTASVISSSSRMPTTLPETGTGVLPGSKGAGSSGICRTRFSTLSRHAEFMMPPVRFFPREPRGPYGFSTCVPVRACPSACPWHARNRCTCRPPVHPSR